jgi:hypothetical protein
MNIVTFPAKCESLIGQNVLNLNGRRTHKAMPEIEERGRA